MEKYLLILLIFFVFVGIFIVKTSQYENYRNRNKKSFEERQLEQMINYINGLIYKCPSQYENRLSLI